MGKKKQEPLPKAAEEAQKGGAAMANETRKRASGPHKNKKKEMDRNACRKRVKDDE